jgi:hypothetical protein
MTYEDYNDELSKITIWECNKETKYVSINVHHWYLQGYDFILCVYYIKETDSVEAFWARGTNYWKDFGNDWRAESFNAVFDEALNVRDELFFNLDILSKRRSNDIKK